GVRATFEPIIVKAVAKPAPSRVIELPAEPIVAVPPKPIEVKAGSEDAAAAMLELLELTVQKKASDLHLTTAFAPCLRVDGDIVPIEGYGAIGADRLREMVFSIAPPHNREQWLATKDTDFAYETAQARFR